MAAGARQRLRARDDVVRRQPARERSELRLNVVSKRVWSRAEPGIVTHFRGGGPRGLALAAVEDIQGIYVDRGNAIGIQILDLRRKEGTECRGGSIRRARIEERAEGVVLVRYRGEQQR